MFKSGFRGFAPKGFISGIAFFVLVLCSANAHAGGALKIIELETADGVKFPAFIAGPEDSDKGILLVHDWFGASEFYAETAFRLGEEGYRVIAIDYYDGEDATTHQGAFALMQKVDAGLTAEKVQAGLDALKSEGRKIGAFGFSLGTEYAWRGALNDADVAAVALWYGFTPTTDEHVEGLNADTLIILGSLDGPAADQGSTYSKLMDAHGKKGELYIYPQAHHAFAQPLFNAGETYDPVGAEISWLITADFFARKLN